MSILCQKVRADMFFRLDEIYKQCCTYAILHCCSLHEAQLAVIGEVLFAE